MNRIIKIILSLLVILGIVCGWFWYKNHNLPKNLAVVYTLDGNGEKKFDDLMENQLADTGFIVTDPHKRINDSYEKHYGSTNLDMISFMSSMNLEKVRELLVAEPRLALYSPFNMLAYKIKGQNSTQVMHLTPEAILDIEGIEDEGVRAKYIAMFKPLDAKIQKVYGGKQTFIKYDKLDENRIMNYEITFKRPADIAEFVSQFQEKFEESFEKKKYLIAGYYDFKVNLENTPQAPLPEYDAFWIYSLCHLEFSYNIFDKAGLRPDAGIFAPCTMYMYIKKGTNKLVIGMPKLQNWTTTLNITDKVRVSYAQKLDVEIPQILTSLGFVEIGSGKSANYATSGAIREAGTTIAKGDTFKSPNPNAGSVVNNKVPAYIRSKFQITDEVIKALKKGGFTHLATENINPNQSVIIFTNNDIMATASDGLGGFGATLKVLVDKGNNQLTITNPIYQSSAFGASNVHRALAQKILMQIRKIFPNSIDSDEKLDYKDIENYHFMIAMPYYKDMIEVGSGTNASLIAKLKSNKSFIYEQKLANGASLLGVKLSDKTTKFAAKIGSQNALVLPYSILVQNNKAYIMHPKYYIALMYPQLSLETFMTIATVPGAIENEIKALF